MRDHRGDEGELGDDVARRRAVERVLGGPVQSELARDELRVEAERRPGERSPAVRRDGSARRPVAQALQVAHERPGVRLQVVREQHRLRVLQVRAPGHDRVGVRLGLRHERVDDAQDVAGDRARVIEEVHPHQGRDLVVAAAAGAQLAAELGTRRRAMSACSSAPCTSSSCGPGRSVPSVMPRASTSSPSCIACSSSAVRYPAAASAFAWACEPAMSYSARSQSKCVDRLSAASSGEGPVAKRAPQSAPSLVPSPFASLTRSA